MLAEDFSKLSILIGEKQPLELGATAGEQKISIHRNFKKALEDNYGLSESIALIQTDGVCITFNELNIRAKKLASQLLRAIEERESTLVDLPADRIVAVCLPPSIDLIVSLLAIFKTGSAYVPIDSAFPHDRTVHIIEDSKPIFLLSSQTILASATSLAAATEKTKVPVLDFNELNNENLTTTEVLVANHNDRHLAAVLYTSGSTGIPKGVRLDHKTILQRLNWQWIRFPYGPQEVGCFKTALTFVDSISEIWGPILSGIPLHIVPKQVLQDTEKFIEVLEVAKITRLVHVPSLLKAILTILKSRDFGPPILTNLKMWICSGEVLSSELLLDFYHVFPEGTKLCNFYGSTEVMGDVTYAQFESSAEVIDSLQDNKVPIGIPMFNCEIYLLDTNKKLIKKGDIGEIYVAGSHLCSEYMNNREMNRFLKNHFNDSSGYEIMFQTGDYGRLVNNQVYFEGRADSQVKVRGHRIDLNEVSSTINSMEEVLTATVLCYKTGEPAQEIVAFILLKNSTNLDIIQEKLKKSLISYMMPKLVQVEEMPLY